MANYTAFIVALIIIVIIVLIAGLKLIREYQRAVIFRLGRLSGVKGPGLFFVIPFIDQIQIIDQRTLVIDVPRQEAITKDNVPTIVNAASANIAPIAMISPSSLNDTLYPL